MITAEQLLDIAEIISLSGTCNRAQVGAVLTVDRRIIATGYNGSPSGLPHCDHDNDLIPDAGCKTAVHAEVNAIAFAARHGVSTEGSTLYTTMSPCEQCAKLLINAGVKGVIYRDRYRDLAGLNLLSDVGIRIGDASQSKLHGM